MEHWMNGWGWWWMSLMMVFWVVVLGAVVYVAVQLALRPTRQRQQWRSPAEGSPTSCTGSRKELGGAD